MAKITTLIILLVIIASDMNAKVTSEIDNYFRSNICSLRQAINANNGLSDDQIEFLTIVWFLSNEDQLSMCKYNVKNLDNDLRYIEHWYELNRDLLSWDLVVDTRNLLNNFLFINSPLSDEMSLFELKYNNLQKRLRYRGIIKTNSKQCNYPTKSQKEGNKVILEYIHKNMEILNTLFNCGQNESGFVNSVFLCNRVLEFVFVIGCLCGISKYLNPVIPTLDWIQFNDIKDYIFMYENTIPLKKFEFLKNLWKSKVQFMDKEEYDKAFNSGMFLYE